MLLETFCAQFPLNKCLNSGAQGEPEILYSKSPTSSTRKVHFFIMDQPSTYNVIIRRPKLNKLRAITTTFHLLMKFPTKTGVWVMEGDQAQARVSYIRGTDNNGISKLINTIY